MLGAEVICYIAIDKLTQMGGWMDGRMDGLMDGMDRGNGWLKGVLCRKRDSIGKVRGGIQIPTEFCHPGKPKEVCNPGVPRFYLSFSGLLRQTCRGEWIMSLQAER